MIELHITSNAEGLQQKLQRYPFEMKQEVAVAVKRTGYKIERDAKVKAPVITGNLRRQINFMEGDVLNGYVRSNAEYSGKVHGEPLAPALKRKQTPFLSDAAEANRGTLTEEIAQAIVRAMDRLK